MSYHLPEADMVRLEQAGKKEKDDSSSLFYTFVSSCIGFALPAVQSAYTLYSKDYSKSTSIITSVGYDFAPLGLFLISMTAMIAFWYQKYQLKKNAKSEDSFQDILDRITQRRIKQRRD